MSFFASPTLALVFALFVICGETCLHIGPLISAPGELSSWPIYVWMAGSLLIFGATRAQRDGIAGRLWLIAAWAFNASLMAGASFDLLGELLAGAPPPPGELIPLPVFLGLITMLLVL